MKKITFTTLLLLVFINTNAQDILETVTKEVCSCIESKKESMKGLPQNQLQTQLGLCMLASYNNHESVVKAKYGDVMADEKNMEKFAEAIGMKMVTICPETLMSIAGAMGEGGEDTATAAEVKSVEGTITEIKNDQFTTISVKDKNSRMYTFLVLNYFDTSSLIIGNELNKNNSVIIKYSEVELYDNKAKEFRFYKVISGIEKK
ncbi:MAG TPA: hypothetical protein PKN96_06780 [Flavobacterium sp.]|uniref:hypothetical protein n=1 Tax=Flavobacterium sp. TaxID=239 RepID=UPI002B80A2C0|nr:hypothetical protein [Flavobacterium sp.]HNP32980.1 hypothetical protein [Flavobacterium sp.]